MSSNLVDVLYVSFLVAVVSGREKEGAPLAAALPLEGEEDVMAEVVATRARPRSLLIGQAGRPVASLLARFGHSRRR